MNVVGAYSLHKDKKAFLHLPSTSDENDETKDSLFVITH